MAEPGTEQTTPPSDQVDQAVTDQPPQAVPDAAPPPAPDADVDAVPAAAAAEPPADPDSEPTPPPVDLSTDEGITAAVEDSPQLKAYLDKQKLDGINEGAQAKQNELRRAAGAPEAVKRWASQFVTKVCELTPEQAEQESEFITNQALQFVFADFTKQLPEHTLADYDIPVEAREEAVKLRESGDYNGMLQTYFTAAATDRLGKMDAKDAPPGSNLEKTTRAWAREMSAAELKANGIEQQTPVPGAPPTPSGSPVGTKVNKAAAFDLKGTPGQGHKLVEAALAGDL